MKFIRNLFVHFGNEDLSLTAAALSFTTVLSVVPFLAVTLAALNHFDALDALTPKVEAALLANFSGTAGAEGVALMQKGIKRILNGRMGSLGALILILISTRAMVGLERAFHRIWQVKNKRHVAKRILYYWIFLLLFPFALAFWVAVNAGLGNISAWPVRPGYLVLFLLLFTLQKWLPSHQVRTFPALMGTAFSVLLLGLLTKAYKLLSIQVFSYGKVYGSLAAIPTFLLWVFLVWMGVLWGVALTAAVQKQDA